MFSYTYRARGAGAALQVQLVTQVRCFFGSIGMGNPSMYILWTSLL